MLAVERRNLILEKLQEDKKVIVSELSQEFQVSEETIRRDLDKLDKSQIHLSIDLKSYTAAGEYEVPVKIEVPDGYQVVDEIKVKVTLADANSNVVSQKPES